MFTQYVMAANLTIRISRTDDHKTNNISIFRTPYMGNRYTNTIENYIEEFATKKETNPHTVCV